MAYSLLVFYSVVWRFWCQSTTEHIATVNWSSNTTTVRWQQLRSLDDIIAVIYR